MAVNNAEFIETWNRFNGDADKVADALERTTGSCLSRASKIRNHPEPDKRVPLVSNSKTRGRKSQEDDTDYDSIRQDMAKSRGISLEQLQQESDDNFKEVQKRSNKRIANKKEKEEKTELEKSAI